MFEILFSCDRKVQYERDDGFEINKVVQKSSIAEENVPKDSIRYQHKLLSIIIVA